MQPRGESDAPARARILVIGPAALRDDVRAALPDCAIIASRHALEGVWQAGAAPLDGAVIGMSVGERGLLAVRRLRELAPNARILATCAPLDEPLARQALEAGADDYVLEPLEAAALLEFFQKLPDAPAVAQHAAQQSPDREGGVSSAPLPSGPAPEPLPTPPAPQLAPSDVHQLAETLRRLDEGLRPTLERLAELVRGAFDASGVSIRWGDLEVQAGCPQPPSLTEQLVHREQVHGRLELGAPRAGPHAPGAQARLAEYARLIEITAVNAREREHWRDMAWTDDLSGLRNRRFFERSLDDLIRRATEQRLRITVLLFDIDNFKRYNDRYGHETGDKLLREVALLLTRCSRETDVVCRFGGDEFAVAFWDAEKPRTPGSDHPREPILLCRRFHEAIRTHAFSCLGEHGPGPVTISGGLACFPWNGITREQLMRAADQALLAAKQTGKNRIHLAGEGSHVACE